MPARTSHPGILKSLGALLCALLLVPVAAGAKPPKPKKPKPGQQQPAGDQTPPPQSQGEPVSTQQAPPAGLDAVDSKLWRYQTGEARSALGRFTDQTDTNAYVSIASGRVLEQEEKYSEAEGRFRKAAELAPNEPAAWVYLGEVRLRQRNEGGANEAFRKAAELAQAKGGAEAAYYLGVAQQRLRQFDQAVSTLEGARAPQPALIPYQIGITRSFQQNWPAAAEQFNRAIEMDGGLAYAYYYRGLVQDKLGRKDLLINDMDRFLALAPNAPEAEKARAVLRSVKR